MGRTATFKRNSSESSIEVTLDLDGKGVNKINTGIGFFDHMLTLFSVHSMTDIDIICKGDLHTDCHHSIEDTGIVLGKAVSKALSDRAGIQRYGYFFIPMDESLALASIDLGGRPYLVFDCEFASPMLGNMSAQMVEEFFRAFCVNAGITLHLKLFYGKNDHHKCEALFKAFAHAFKMAAAKDTSIVGVLSSKGLIDL